MADDEAPMTSTPGSDPRRLRIDQQLRKLVGPGPATFYRDACALMDDPTRLLSTSHLVGHLVREVESALRAVLTPMASTAQASTGSTDQSRGNGHRRSILAILSALNIAATDAVAQKWLDEAGTYQEWAHRRDLTEPPLITEAFSQFFDDFEGILDYVLNRMEANYATVFVTLDALAAKSPATEADVKFLLNNVPRHFVALGRFFDAITDRSWLPLLRNKDVFSAPPGPEPHDDGTVSFPPWPVMRYLIRLAPELPDEVIETVREIPATDNVMVNAAIVDVARALPVRKAVNLIPRVLATLDSPYRMGFPVRLAELIGRFAAEGDLSSAMELARELLSFEASATEADEISSEMARSLREPRLRVDEHIHAEILQRQVPPLIASAGVPAIELLAGLLEEAIVISSSDAMIEAGEDFSSIWRRDVSPEGLSHDLGIKSRLVSALRDGIVARVGAVPDDLGAIVDLLDARWWSVFRRLALHLLALYGSQTLATVEARLASQETFDDDQLRPEYDRLLAAHFGTLADGTRAAVLGFIDTGGDVDSHAEWIRTVHGRDPTAGELRTYVEVWQLERLTPIADQLPEDWRIRYEQLLATYGPPPSHTPVAGGGFVAARTPTTAEELAALGVDELIGYLMGFEPSGEFLGPSKGGLATTLTDVVAADPARYLLAAGRLGELDVEYAHAVLNGVHRVMTGGTEVDWAQVLELCAAIVAHPRMAPDDQEIDDGWGWARLDVMRLLSTGFTAAHPLRDEHRARVFAVIAAVATDPHPSPVDEERYGPPNMSPDDLALNSVRPRAIDVAVQYGVWIYRRHPDDPFREITDLIDEHLDSAADPSIAVRAVLGSQFSNLMALDGTWATRAADRIFAVGESQRRLWEAAWDAFLWRGLQNKPTWIALRDKYALAVARIVPDTDDRRQQSRDRALANHLTSLYWAGELPLDEGLIAEFFAIADEETRRQALESIGRGLAQEGPALDEAVMTRLFALWDRRVEAARSNRSIELSAFGWWFCSTRLPVEPRIKGLQDALDISGSAEPAHLVIDQLATLSSGAPREAAELLVAMVEHESDGWRLSLWDDSATTVIRTALASSDPEALRLAREIASRAAARGHTTWLDVT